MTHLNDAKNRKSSSDKILQEIKQGRDEIKSVQRSLAKHREDTAINVIILSSLLTRILERSGHD